MPVRPDAWAVRCNFCQVDVSLLGPTNQPPQRSTTSSPKPPPTPKSAILRNKVLLLVCVGLYGVLAIPTIHFLDKFDQTGRAAAIGAIASVLGFILYGLGYRLLACILTLPIGIILLAKPFVHPVVYDGRVSSLNSETHYYFLIPGIGILVVFGWLSLGAFDKLDWPFEITRRLRISAGVCFVMGLVASQIWFGGPTVSEVLVQFGPRGTEMRKQFFQFAKSLPEVGNVEIHEEKLVPAPVWREGRSETNNIEIIMVEQLWNVDEEPISRNFYLSQDLYYSIRWTGPKNPLSSSVMGDRGGDFEKRLTHAFGLPWIAAYRPGKAGYEIFVYDLHTGKIVASTIAKGFAGDITKDRQILLDALAQATGGTFSMK